jgi:glycosyltransferase involved in cell wall biosynthesis
LSETPLVSIIIPVYNRSSLVIEAVTSALDQTYRNREIVVVDDGSSDTTPSVLARVPGIELLRTEHTGRAGATRNEGIRYSRGDLIAFLDSDDLWMPHKLEKQVGFMMQNSDLEISHTRELWRRGDRTVSQKGQRHRRAGDIFADALRKCIIGPSTVMLRRGVLEQVGPFDPTLEIAEDYELWLRVCARYSVGYIDEPLTVKRAGHGDQLSEKYGQIEIFRIEALQKLLEGKVFTAQQHTLAARELARKCEIYAAGCAKRGREEESLRFARLARYWGC